jgi:hypothetical protein
MKLTFYLKITNEVNSPPDKKPYGGSAIFTGLAKVLGGPFEALSPQFEHVR